MRTSNSIKNIFISMMTNIIAMLIGFGIQAIFVRTLNSEYLGINGLFTNILSLFAIVEFGLGNAMVYSLYKPVAEDDKEKIIILMNFYKRTYRVIAIFIFAIAMLLLPFINSIVGPTKIPENINFIYFLFVIDITASYLLTYKRSILYANQKSYIMNLVHMLYLIFMNLCQAIILLTMKNFILFLIIKILFRILENVVINIIANKKYEFLKKKVVKSLEKEEKKVILKKIKGLLFYKTGNAVVSATDNITISTFLGVSVVGTYYNYNIIMVALTQLFTQAFNSITASVGNLLVEEKDPEKVYDIYKKILMFNSWIYGFATTAIYSVIGSFIEVWVGKEYLLSNTVLIILIINFYLQGMRRTYMIFKEAAGIFHEDRYFSMIEAVTNIIFSVLLAKILGLIGIFIGTIIGTLPIILYDYPVIIYKKIFRKKYVTYLKENITFFIANMLFVFLVSIITTYIVLDNVILSIIVKAIVCTLVYNILYVICFYRTKEFKYFKELIKKIVKRTN